MVELSESQIHRGDEQAPDKEELKVVDGLGGEEEKAKEEADQN